MKAFTVVVHSHGEDPHDDVYEDVYEVQADDERAALAAATVAWEESVLEEWPDLQLEEAFILPEDADPETFFISQPTL